MTKTELAELINVLATDTVNAIGPRLIRNDHDRGIVFRDVRAALHGLADRILPQGQDERTFVAGWFAGQPVRVPAPPL